jgi:hypothetical protein
MKYLGRFPMGSFSLDFTIEIVRVNDEPTLMLFGSHTGGSGWANFGGEKAVEMLKWLASK